MCARAFVCVCGGGGREWLGRGGGAVGKVTFRLQHEDKCATNKIAVNVSISTNLKSLLFIIEVMANKSGVGIL